MHDFEKSMLRYFAETHPEILKEIRDKGDISDELNEKIREAMQKALDEFLLIKGV